MNKKIIIIVSLALVVLVAVAVVFVVVFKGNDSSGSIEITTDAESTYANDTADILICKTSGDLDKIVKEKGYLSYYEEDSYNIISAKALGADVDIEAICSNDIIQNMTLSMTLLEIPYPMPEISSSGEYLEPEYVAHDFTKEEKEKTQAAFDKVKLEFENFVGCGEITNYDLIPTGHGDTSIVTTMSEEDQFYNGYLVREISVRDVDGILWLLRYYVDDYNAYATLIKVVDETNYKGFIPIIDMTKNY